MHFWKGSTKNDSVLNEGVVKCGELCFSRKLTCMDCPSHQGLLTSGMWLQSLAWTHSLLLLAIPWAHCKGLAAPLCLVGQRVPRYTVKPRSLHDLLGALVGRILSFQSLWNLFGISTEARTAFFWKFDFISYAKFMDTLHILTWNHFLKHFYEANKMQKICRY